MKALIAMSGGVDSSVSAFLMKNKGFDCIGAMMKLQSDKTFLAGSNNSDEKLLMNKCASEDNVKDAKKVADALDIPFEVYNFSDKFEEKVIGQFIDCYEKGLTPNPCIYCNRYLKFESLFEKGKEKDCDLIVTGHYARVEYNEKTGRYILKKAKNLSKDQSYVLYSLTQEQLAHTAFPLGEMTKEEVREIAEKEGFVNANKGESQDICFIPDGDYAAFIEKYTNKTYPEGNFTDTSGKVLGRHKGIIRYTVGQRKGLGLALNEPMYVKEVNLKENTVLLARDEELFTKELIADSLNWISIPDIRPGESIRVLAKIRYRHKEAPATVTLCEDTELALNNKEFSKNILNKKVRVIFDEAQRAITKGQAVVFYDYNDNDIVIGGGTIV